MARIAEMFPIQITLHPGIVSNVFACLIDHFHPHCFIVFLAQRPYVRQLICGSDKVLTANASVHCVKMNEFAYEEHPRLTTIVKEKAV